MISRYNAGKATEAEQAFVDAYYDHLGKTNQDLDDDLGLQMKNRVMAHVNGGHTSVHRIFPIYRLVAAACLLAVVGFGVYFMLKPSPVKSYAVVMKNDIKPGGNQAVLTLSNGQKIVLGNQQGQIASQGQTKIDLSANGQINYSNTGNTTESLYNTLTVPIGNHRDITLADGTQVSLDAGSSLTFPVTFNGAERRVTLTGQGFFKVKHNAAQPFMVKVNELTVRDIGTEFNINAYNDERDVKTTLFEGSVKVNEQLLNPGQQAVAVNNNISVKQADLETVGAWRNNDFVFRNQTLRATMRQIARWYNVNVVYDHAPEDLRIHAAISRNRNISAVLQLIQSTGEVKFEIDGNTVFVRK